MRDKYLPLKAFGVETQAPRWVLTILSLILIGGIGYMVFRKVYEEPERVLINLKDANRQLSAEVEEYSLHVMEEPQKHELFEDTDGKLALRVFKDHCILIQRQTIRGLRTKLVMDLARNSVTHYAEPSWNVLPVAFAQGTCSRGCLNPHPGGNFKWWYGHQNGAWVEVWRQWPDGCQHVQMFNAQNRYWDSNPDGSARVRWTCCVH